jgi:hypothetical protein
VSVTALVLALGLTFVHGGLGVVGQLAGIDGLVVVLVGLSGAAVLFSRLVPESDQMLG